MMVSQSLLIKHFQYFQAMAVFALFRFFCDVACTVNHFMSRPAHSGMPAHSIFCHSFSVIHYHCYGHF